MTCCSHAHGGSFCHIRRIKQAVQGRTGAGQRRISRAFTLQDALNLTQLGIFRKDDAFEVVFDPGLDEVEKRCLGPVPALGGNTGCWHFHITTLRKETFAPSSVYRLIELSYCTCHVGDGQRGLGHLVACHAECLVCVSPIEQSVPLSECLGRRDSYSRSDHNQRNFRKILQWIDFLATIDSENGSADQEQREIATYFGSYAQLVLWSEFDAERVLQSKHRGDGIGRSGAHSTLHRKTLFDHDDDFPERRVFRRADMLPLTILPSGL